MGDVLDAPRRRPEGEHVADAGLVDHLLVELAHPAARALAGGQEDAVQAAVGDGAAAGDGQPLGSRTRGEHVGVPVPHDARAQLGELLAGVAAGEHVEHRLEHAARQRGERRRARPAGRPGRRRSSRPWRTWPRPAGPGRRAGWRAAAAPRWRPARIRSTTTAVCTRSPRNFGKTTPRETAPTWWPARPTRCSPDATLGGDSTCTTRSTAPMSMPSSRELVATTAGSRPALRSSSISARCSLLTEPWWARASTAGAPLAAPAWAMTSAGARPAPRRAAAATALVRARLGRPPGARPTPR